VSSVPQHLILDRCYLHGDPSTGQRRGLALNSGDAQVVNSYFSDFKGINEDTQAVAGWNGPGPYLIENNYLEAAGENVMFGGSDPYITDLVPSNITIRRNLISRPLAWMSSSWVVKNLIELKNAQNVTIEGNVIENNWSAGQQGYSIVMQPRNQSGSAPWSTVRNITIRNNVIRHIAAAFNICGYDNLHTAQQLRGVVIRNNLMYDISTKYSTPNRPANGWMGIMGCGPANITIDHNTVDNDGTSAIQFYAGYAPSGYQIQGFVLKNNLLRDNRYGIFGDNSSEGIPALTKYTPNAYVQANSIGGAQASIYPTGNDYPTLTQWLADFVNRSAANYQLVSTSLSNNAATDGKDIGVDFAELNAALSGTAAAPPPSSTGSSTPYSGTPAPLPGKVQFENYDVGGEGVAYHDTTAGNTGGAYRSTSVDIQPTTDTGGGYNIGWVVAGEWLTYTVSVASSSTYTLDVRVAQQASGGTFHVDVDGVNKTGSIGVPNTGGWQAWRTITKTGISLSAGTHVVRVVMDANAGSGAVGNFNWFSFTAAVSSASSDTTPYTGTPVAVPNRVPFENYDIGGEGVAYHDTTAGNTGGAYRTNNVDIQKTSDSNGSYNVGWVAAGEWLKYTIAVPASGTYALDLRVAQEGSGGSFRVEVDGVDKTGPITAPNTGGWQAWQTMTRTGISLNAGTHVVRVVMTGNGSSGSVANFNWFAFR
jgi:carbohydrate binding protein with CBM6 domain/parallel beta helix pectate lyase-like protein